MKNKDVIILHIYRRKLERVRKKQKNNKNI